ncbi:hypothetical protein N9289_02205 [Candidatus Poseidonia sp.]|nr:hypothetical protein [Poseidonia sp.]
MTDDERGLDHLMEQNEAELSFLSAYGGVEGNRDVDSSSILGALKRFLQAGGIACEGDDSAITFACGEASASSDGCQFIFNGEDLPLVQSDLIATGFDKGNLASDRSRVCVYIFDWSAQQRRFIERLVEHHLHG